MKRFELWLILIFWLVFSACSRQKPKMPAAHPFPRVGFGEIEKQIRLLIENNIPIRPDNVDDRYRSLKDLIRMLLHEGAMVDGILTRSQGEEIEELLRHGKGEEASGKVSEAIKRLREFRESDEFARFRENIDTELIPKTSLMGENRLKRMWQRKHEPLRREPYK